MARQSKSQQETVSRVMHEYKHGELRTRASGPKVKNPKQAITIALHEAGATNQESPAANKRNLHRTKTKEAKGETAEAAKEGKAAQARTMKKATSRRHARADAEHTKKELYVKAQQQHVAGRSKMNKAQLERAVR